MDKREVGIERTRSKLSPLLAHNAKSTGKAVDRQTFRQVDE